MSAPPLRAAGKVLGKASSHVLPRERWSEQLSDWPEGDSVHLREEWGCSACPALRDVDSPAAGSAEGAEGRSGACAVDEAAVAEAELRARLTPQGFLTPPKSLGSGSAAARCILETQFLQPRPTGKSSFKAQG